MAPLRLGIIALSASRVCRNTPVAVTPMMDSHSASVVSTVGL